MHDDSHLDMAPQDEQLDAFLDTLRAETHTLSKQSMEALDATARTRLIAGEAMLDTPLWPLLLATLTLTAATLIAYLGVLRLEENLLAITL